MYYHFGDFVRYGISGLEKIVSAQRDNVDARFKLGLAYMDAERFNDAVTILREALALDARHAEAQAHLGRSLAELGFFQLGVNELLLAIPKLEGLLSARPRVWLAEVYLELQQLESTRDAFFSALSANPSCVEAHSGLTELSLLDVSLPRPENFAGPDKDTRLSFLGHGRHESECRVRLFNRGSRTIVLVTQDDTCVGTTPINGAEAAYEAAVKKFNLWDTSVTFVVHDVCGVFGTPELNRVDFSSSAPAVPNALESSSVTEEFSLLENSEFERLTGFRIDWSNIPAP